MEEEKWDIVIKPRYKWYHIEIALIWRYKDLIGLLVRRDFVAVYKQTIFGPLWYFIQPVLTSLTFAFIFGGIAKISTNGAPPMLFYFAGITIWTYFSDCFTRTSSTFISNAGVFGKVYFPRLIMPISVIISTLFKFGMQFFIFMGLLVYYMLTTNHVHPQWGYMWLLPVLIFIMAGLGFGFGILISSLTTKYRDLTFLIGFGVQLLMWASCVVIPLSTMSLKVRYIMLLNPITSVIEAFRFLFLGSGQLLENWLIYGFGFMVILVFLSTIMFSKVEKTFMDTV